MNNINFAELEIEYKADFHEWIERTIFEDNFKYDLKGLLKRLKKPYCIESDFIQETKNIKLLYYILRKKCKNMYKNKKYNTVIHQTAAKNPNCPVELLLEVLERGEDDDTSLLASENPSCPSEYRIKWLYKIGKITKEDSSKHIIEYENVKENSVDISDLKELLNNME